MGAVLGTGSKKSANIEINIIPFVDVMSCLTAFLLVSAVWVNTAHLKNEAAGKGQTPTVDTPHPKLAVLIEWDQMLVTATPSGETRQGGEAIPRFTCSRRHAASCATTKHWRVSFPILRR